jgi:hypothetical protein
MYRISRLRRVQAVLAAVLLLVAGVALSPVWAEDEGVFADEYYTGLYDAGGVYDDDWYFDAYDAPAAYPYWYGGYGWYGHYPYYAGVYDDRWGANDWYYDYYDYYDYDNDWWDWDIGF